MSQSIEPDDIRSKAVPLYQLLTIGRRDRSGDFCPGAGLARNQALTVIGSVLSEANDRQAINWIARHMPADGSALQ